jgi:hypothetical protein
VLYLFHLALGTLIVAFDPRTGCASCWLILIIHVKITIFVFSSYLLSFLYLWLVPHLPSRPF